jgi:hypothetical protein
MLVGGGGNGVRGRFLPPKVVTAEQEEEEE